MTDYLLMVQYHQCAFRGFGHAGEALIVFGIRSRGNMSQKTFFYIISIKAKPSHTIINFIILITDKQIRFAVSILMIDVGKNAGRLFAGFIMTGVTI